MKSVYKALITVCPCIPNEMRKLLKLFGKFGSKIKTEWNVRVEISVKTANDKIIKQLLGSVQGLQLTRRFVSIWSAAQLSGQKVEQTKLSLNCPHLKMNLRFDLETKTAAIISLNIGLKTRRREMRQLEFSRLKWIKLLIAKSRAKKRQVLISSRFN